MTDRPPSPPPAEKSARASSRVATAARVVLRAVQAFCWRQRAAGYRPPPRVCRPRCQGVRVHTQPISFAQLDLHHRFTGVSPPGGEVCHESVLPGQRAVFRWTGEPSVPGGGGWQNVAQTNEKNIFWLFSKMCSASPPPQAAKASAVNVRDCFSGKGNVSTRQCNWTFSPGSR